MTGELILVEKTETKLSDYAIVLGSLKEEMKKTLAQQETSTKSPSLFLALRSCSYLEQFNLKCYDYGLNRTDHQMSTSRMRNDSLFGFSAPKY